MCSGALGNGSKWRRKAEAFSARSIDRNPRRDAAEGPHRLAPGVKQAQWPTGQLHASETVHTHLAQIRPLSILSIYLPVSFQFRFLSHFEPLWVSPEAQTDGFE